MNPKVAQWLAMTVQAQNDFIGELIGASPMVDRYLYAGDVHLQRILSKSPEEAADLLTFIKGKGWKKFAELHELKLRQRGTLSVRERRWHLRYSDTSCGGLFVVEALQQKGFTVLILADQNAWRCSATRADTLHTYSHKAKTLQEAACIMAIHALSGSTS